MTPEQVEACAKRAYEIMQANVNEPTGWDASKNKRFWIDLVGAWERHGGKPSNLQEHCVDQAVKEFREANPETAPEVADRPLIVPPIAAAAASAETAPKGDKKPDSKGGNAPK